MCALEGLVMNPAFWPGRRVFLTGHTGFKGGWLSLWLQQLGADVTGFALPPPTQPSIFEAARVGQGMTSVTGDIRDLDTLRSALRRASPEIVIHMAAQPLVRRSYLDPVETYSTNVMGVVHLFEAVRCVPGIRAVLNVTTDKCYDNREWAWGYRENEAMGGHDPYSSSKGCAELITSAYRSSFFRGNEPGSPAVAIATARAGNVIGGGDWATDRLVPDMVAAFEAGQSVRVRHPHAVRPWQHVLEPLRGYLSLSQALVERGASVAQAWNFGPLDDDARPVSWVVNRMAAEWGGNASWIEDRGEHPHEASYLKLDISKARQGLGWQPRLRLPQAIALVAEWHKATRAGQDARAVTLAQISQYQQLADRPT